MGFELPVARSVAVNPTQAEMRAWTLEFMPRVTETEFGNLNYQAETKARLTASTFFVSADDEFKNRISRAEADEWAARQDGYIAEHDMILIEGYIGPDPEFRTGCRLYIETSPPCSSSCTSRRTTPGSRSSR
jgi:phosphoenolpyruvate carboxykinase (ATP)